MSLPAVNHHRPGVRGCGGFDPSQEGQQSCGVIRDAVLRPRCEVKLADLMLGWITPLMWYKHYRNVFSTLLSFCLHYQTKQFSSVVLIFDNKMNLFWKHLPAPWRRCARCILPVFLFSIKWFLCLRIARCHRASIYSTSSKTHTHMHTIINKNSYLNNNANTHLWQYDSAEAKISIV